MHKTFYASGFIYHLPSQQILLQQQAPSSLAFPWLLFEKEHLPNEQPNEVFRSIIFNFLGIVLDSTDPIYSYLNEATQKTNSLLYGTIKVLQEFPSKNGFTFRWFSFKEVLKLQATEQTKHDIVVGQRVIEAAGRKERGEHTF